MLFLGAPWLIRASSILSEGGQAAVAAASDARLHLAGCVVGGARAAPPHLHDLPSTERAAEEAAASPADAHGANLGAGGGRLGPVLGVSLLGRSAFPFMP